MRFKLRAVEACVFKLALDQATRPEASRTSTCCPEALAAKRRAFQLGQVERRALKRSAVKRIAIKLRTAERRAFEIRAGEIYSRQACEIEDRAFQIAAASEIDEVPPLRLLGFIDAKTFKDVEACEHECV